ncbi:MAG: hypothetical protein WCW46_00225 [Candidatus Paceibacterota bacterium]
MENKKTFEIPTPVAIIIAGALLSGAWMFNNWLNLPVNQQKTTLAAQKKVQVQLSDAEKKVIPAGGVELPVTWGELGKQLTDVGVIDKEKFKKLYVDRQEWNAEYDKLLSGNNTGKIRVTPENSPFLLNLLWALGLAQNNPILFDKEDIMNPKYANGKTPGSTFASTGGWNMAVGNSMDHYGKHTFFNLTPEQQALVDKISRGVYRPCCGNSTHFPDCNHGMAMLGLLELMASQDASEQDMWKAALAINSYWFPDTYITIASYMKEKKNIEWKNVNPQEVLGVDYSSGQGFAKISAQVAPVSGSSRGGSGCGISSGAPAETVAQPQRRQSGCGL